MRLVLICNEAPFPTIHGGRVDVWRRICALKAEGVEIFLVFWTGDRSSEMPSDDALKRMGQETYSISFYTIRRTILERVKRLLRLFRWPSHVASRVLCSRDCADLLKRVHAFKPDAIWLESIYGGVLAEKLAVDFNLPMFCRSHNIEHLYMARQISQTSHLRDRLAWSLNLLHLRDFEYATLRRSARFFDISMDDLAFWRKAGLSNGEWFPPMVDRDFAMRLGAPRNREPGFDVGYLGNLFSPNNVDGVLWLINEVVGRLRTVRPGLRVFVAGARPVSRIVEAAQSNGVSLIANPDDVVPLLRNARVLVNPVFSGSGVNIKSVEMLFSPAQLVATTQGLAGLPVEVTQHFRCADTPEAFASQILDALDASGFDTSAERAAARALFSCARAEELIRRMQEDIDRHSELPVR